MTHQLSKRIGLRSAGRRESVDVGLTFWESNNNHCLPDDGSQRHFLWYPLGLHNGNGGAETLCHLPAGPGTEQALWATGSALSSFREFKAPLSTPWGTGRSVVLSLPRVSRVTHVCSALLVLHADKIHLLHSCLRFRETRARDKEL